MLDTTKITGKTDRAQLTANSILIVDDDPNILSFLIKILEDQIGISFAPDGPKALEYVHAHKPALVLLDVDMPDMDGFDVCRQLKEDPATRHIPIIFLTAKDNKEDMAEGLRLGAVDYITKPFDTAVVISKVKNQLAHIPARQAAAPEPKAPEQPVPPVPTTAVGDKKSHLSTVLMVLAVLLIIGGGIYVYKTPYPPEPPTAAVTSPAPVKWPFNSKCEQSPVASWWGNTTHFSIADYVIRRHQGDWNPYLDKWINQLNRMRDVADRNGSAKVSSGLVLKGDDLKIHVDRLARRVTVIRCLAAEALRVK